MFVERDETMWVGKYTRRVLSNGFWVDWLSWRSPWDGFGVGHDDDEDYERVIRCAPIYNETSSRPSVWRTRLPGVPGSQRDWSALSPALKHMLATANPRATPEHLETAYWEIMEIMGVFA